MVRVIKVDFVSHSDSKGARTSIYSVDLQPKGRRLATGGGDATVKIWSADAMLLGPEETSQSLLSTLQSHTGSVNTVRWSRDGSLLASGSDDKTVLIYGLDDQKNGSLIRTKNKEAWIRLYTLSGHTLDVTDLDWSTSGVIASASMDNLIKIWNVGTRNSIVSNFGTATIVSSSTSLSGHESFVKGVSFDPIDKYLISSGADNMLIIWDCKTYVEITRLTTVMGDGPDSTLFRRLSWAPDGSCVCATSASKSSRPIGVVLRRSTWEQMADLVGHSVPSISTRFCPSLLVDKESKEVRNCVALGDQRGLLTIWGTDNTSPIMVLKDAFTNDVTDIAWMVCEDERVVLCCSSLDGSFLMIDFDSALGAPMDGVRIDRHFKRMYGQGINEIHRQQQSLVEGPEVLLYSRGLPGQGATEAAQPAPLVASPTSHKANLSNASGSEPQREINILALQKHTVTKDGKKRIMPVSQAQVQAAQTESLPTPTHSAVGLGESMDATYGGDNNNNSYNNAFDPLMDARFMSRTSQSRPLPYPQHNHNHHGSDKRPRLTPPPPPQTAPTRLLKMTFNKENIVCCVPLENCDGSDIEAQKAVRCTASSSFKTAGLEHLHPSSLGASNNALFLRSAKLNRPSFLAGSRESGASALTAVRLFRGGLGGVKGDSHVWSTTVPGEATCMCGVKQQLGSSDGEIEDGLLLGVVAVGTTDGSLYLLSLGCGMQLTPPLVLGASLVSVDAVVIANSNRDNKESFIRLLALTAYGEMWMWDVLDEGRLKLHSRYHVRDVLVSMRCRSSSGAAKANNNNNNSNSNNNNSSNEDCYVEECVLNDQGQATLLARSPRAVGGEWQTFSFSSDSGVWVRTADMRLVMSRLFCGATHLDRAGPGSSSAAADTASTRGSLEAALAGGGAEVTALEGLAASRNGFGLADVVALSKPSAAQPSQQQALSTWSHMVTLSHAENRMCVAFNLGREGSSEGRRWLGEWAFLCCKEGLEERVNWVVNRLLLNTRPAPPGADIPQAAAAGAGLGWQWLTCGGAAATALIREALLPAIARSGACQQLLLDVHEALQAQ